MSLIRNCSVKDKNIEKLFLVRDNSFNMFVLNHAITHYKFIDVDSFYDFCNDIYLTTQLKLDMISRIRKDFLDDPRVAKILKLLRRDKESNKVRKQATLAYELHLECLKQIRECDVELGV